MAGDDADGAPSGSTLLGVTHCPKPEHAGAEGALTLVCRQCDVLLCQGCIASHVDAGHAVITTHSAAAERAVSISAALPELRQGVTRQVARAAEARGLLEALALNRVTALESLATASARMHAGVDAKQSAMARDIEAAYEAKVVALQRELAVACAGAAELATMAATAEAALAAPPDPSGILMRVHVGRSVEAALALARCRQAVGSGLSTLRLEASDGAVPGGAIVLGKLVAPMSASSAVSSVCTLASCWFEWCST
jgi:hypothetical protein